LEYLVANKKHVSRDIANTHVTDTCAFTSFPLTKHKITISQTRPNSKKRNHSYADFGSSDMLVDYNQHFVLSQLYLKA